MKPFDCEDVYSDGRYYDLENEDVREDIPFYLRQIRKYGEPVLELACGTGRVTIPVAESGIRITGLDISDKMLIHAKKKAAEKNVDVEWVRDDCRTFRLGKKLNVILFPFNSIAHLQDLESIEACFSSVTKHLTHEGRFIVDMFNPQLDILERDASKRYPMAKYPDPDGMGTVVVTENNAYDRASQINKIKWYYRIGKHAREVVKELNMRIFYPQELDALLHYNGYEIEAKFGDYKETPFRSESPKQIIICRTH